MTVTERIEGRLRGADMAVSELERAWWLDLSDADAVKRHAEKLEYAKGFRAGLRNALTLVSAA